MSRETIQLAVVGDLLLGCWPNDPPPVSTPNERFAEVRQLLADADLRVGNLECTLPGDGGTVETEPRVVTSEAWLDAVSGIGMDALSLANNHAFDCLDAGFDAVRAALEARGIAFFGAGDNLAEARRPALIEFKGVRVALLGGADRRSGTKRFATAAASGVAPLDEQATREQIRLAREQADHVIVYPHWGEERFLVPAPEQVQLARAWIDAGASAVIGHHPHVPQGMHFHAGRPIAYSLGNFAVQEVRFSDGDAIRWNRVERTGCIVRIDLTSVEIGSVERVATYDDGRVIRRAEDHWGRKRLAAVDDALGDDVSLGRYRREHLWVYTIRPVLQKLRWRNLRRLRWRNVRNALRRLGQAGKAR